MSTELGSFLGRFRSTWGALTVAACAGPLSLQTTAPQFITPWPDVGVVTGLATIACGIALLNAYTVFSRLSRARSNLHARLARRAKPVMATAPVLLLGYLLCSSFFVITELQPAANGAKAAYVSVVKGYERLPKIREKFGDEYPDKTLLRDFQYQEEMVWTPTSLTVTRLAMLVLYLGFFYSLTHAIALLMSSQVKKE